MDPSPKLVETLREYHSTKIHCDYLKTKQLHVFSNVREAKVYRK